MATKLMAHGTVIDYTKKPLGKVTRIWKGRKVAWIAECRKCERRGERAVFIPETSARRGGAKSWLSWNHEGRIVDHGIRFMHISDSCTIVVTPENADDILSVVELAEWRAAQTEVQS